MKESFLLLDLISEDNCIFYKGSSKHRSLFGAILSIIVYTLIVICCVYFSLNTIQKLNPTSYFFKQFIEDAGTFPLDNISTQSIFHFFQVCDENDNVLRDDRSFMVLGANSYATNYFGEPGVDFDITKEDTWIYDTCEESDKGYFKDVVTDKQFLNSFCIKRFYNSNTKKVYRQGENGFKYPTIEHGTGTKVASNVGYSIQLLKCINLTELRPEITCRPIEEINTFVQNSLVRVKLGLIDHDFDVAIYEKPVISYINDIKNDLRGESMTNNNLNFSPVLISTDAGLLFQDIKDTKSFRLDLNEKLTYLKSQCPYLLSGWAFFMGNKQEIYSRKYQKLQEYLASVGGAAKALLIAVQIINFLFNQYVLTMDMRELYEELARSVSDKQSKINLNYTSRIDKTIELQQLDKSSSLNIDDSPIGIKAKAALKSSRLEPGGKPNKAQDTIIKKSKIVEGILVNSQIKRFSFCDFLCGKYFFDHSQKKKLNSLSNFWMRIISEENMFKISTQLSVMTIEFNRLAEAEGYNQVLSMY